MFTWCSLTDKEWQAEKRQRRKAIAQKRKEEAAWQAETQRKDVWYEVSVALWVGLREHGRHMKHMGPDAYIIALP